MCSAYGTRLGQSFGVSSLATLLATPVRKAVFAMTDVRLNTPMERPTAPLPRDRAYVIAVNLLPLQDHEMWIEGRSVSRGPLQEGAVMVADLQQNPTFYAVGPFHSIWLQVPMDGLAINDGAMDGVLSCATGEAIADPFVVVLARTMLAMVNCGHRPSQTLVDHLFLALRGHLLDTYGAMPASQPRNANRGLLPWQHRRATALITEHLASGISLQSMADACQLAPSTFLRAFRNTFGETPHQWLIGKRIDKALDLMVDRCISLADIALSVGFADQSHFTRVFVGRMGVSPGAWRSASRGKALAAAE
ncbi:helix-turn-helix domain-containing protein [Dyella telluris]|uniref:Helix-turn-helix transcriptional regulator n=1 Tax=Dyella telluris TaxID=2763498 RepID=A0A7G8Q3F3_9GAMM|nr:AraC family transcriptional regulator [Dyella telluris]QNK01311.1 helix-turn-helix transcriptional regulator [Dyella telluris]